MVTPVTFPLGDVSGSWPIRRDRFNNHCKYDRNGRAGLANRSHRNRSDDGNQVDTEVDHFGGEFRQQMQLPLGRSKFEAEAFAFNPATVALGAPRPSS